MTLSTRLASDWPGWMETISAAIEGVPSGWPFMGVVALLLSYVFIFRFRRIAFKSGNSRPIGLESNPYETNISPALFDEPPSKELALLWLQNKESLTAFWNIENQYPDPEGRLKWRADALHSRDLAYLHAQGLPDDVHLARKGQFHDIIGLREMPTVQQRDQLAFFDLPSAHLNRTSAQREIRWLMESRRNREKWDNRPMDDMQKVFMDYMGMLYDKTTTAKTAELRMGAMLEMRYDDGAEGLDKWFAFEAIYNELTSLTVAKRYKINRPDVKTIRKAFEALLGEGKAPSDQYIQVELVADKIKLLKPSLRVK